MTFPTNPNAGDKYTDSDGTEWVYAGPLTKWYRTEISIPKSSGSVAPQGGPAAPLAPPKLQDLADLSKRAAPSLGEAPTWTYPAGHPEQGQFVYKTSNAHIKNWDSVSNFESGTVVYHQGQIWRATRDSSNVEPRVEDGRTQLYIHVPGEPTFGILPTDITTTPPPSGLQPIQFKLGYWLQYTNDRTISVWKFVIKGADPGTKRPIGEWEGRPWTCFAWRSPNPPSAPVPPNTVVVWIRTKSKSAAPIKGQQDWASLEFESFLSECEDVAAPTPANNDVLLYDATAQKWVNTSLKDLAALIRPFLYTGPPTNPGAKP
jgi:hypothetical protein